jgi:hypothetical protein
MAVEIKRPADDVNDLVGQRSRFRAIGHAELNDGKLVAAQSRNGVRVPHAEAKTRAHLLEQPVA